MNYTTEILDDIFKRLLADIPEVRAAAIVTAEGLPIASVLPQGIDESIIAALTASLYFSAKQLVIEMKKGEYDRLYIKGSKGYLLVQQIGPN
ncbi:MAG: roadblock/LC7 domain-containing protein, partial [Candidatus Thorarchaeota archaeon]